MSATRRTISCTTCGYDLAGVPTRRDGRGEVIARCPECGVEQFVDRVSYRRFLPSALQAATSALPVLAVCLALIAPLVGIGTEAFPGIVARALFIGLPAMFAIGPLLAVWGLGFVGLSRPAPFRTRCLTAIVLYCVNTIVVVACGMIWFPLAAQSGV